ncbi:MAG: peptidylprolyl isomerase [Prevotellaceae bacterium]|jgi:FKBP-type peptidyl-prolyl cis-trans isomerase SlyD|nr:peptidylprolyl isomerase [Prevotellaceae bacterium]
MTKIEKNKVVSLSYTLSVADETIETVKADKPMQFIFGSGYLLPKFEQHIEGKNAGDAFDFNLAAVDAYGEEDPDAIVELPIHVFEVDGKIEDGLLTAGNVLPMTSADGHRLDGMITEVRADVVVMDFNHPLAGDDLHFTGEVVAVRDATSDELANGLFGERASSCSSGCSSCSGCH